MSQTLNPRKIAISLALFAIVGLGSATATQAGTVTFDPLTGIQGTGFGTRITILALQNNDASETGATTFTDPLGLLSPDSTNQDHAITMLELQNIGITGIGNFGLIYNLNQTGNSPNPSLTNLVVRFYNAAGTAVATFNLSPAPFTAPPIDSGNGGSGYPAVFSPTAAEATAIANLFATCPTCLVGASATITGSNDGADSFFVYNSTAPAPGPVPEPASMLLLGTGLIGLGGVVRRRLRK